MPADPQGILATIQARVRGVIIWAKSIPRWILERLDIIERVPVKVMIMGKSLYLFPDPVK